jgi:hypothetical protein
LYGFVFWQNLNDVELPLGWDLGVETTCAMAVDALHMLLDENDQKPVVEW